MLQIRPDNSLTATALARTARALGAACTLLPALASPAHAQLAGGSLDPTTIPKFVAPLRIPGVMPPAGLVTGPDPEHPIIPAYDIEVVQFRQQVLPAADATGAATGLPQTTLWTYAALGHPETRTYPAYTIENLRNLPTRIKWINNLKDESGHFLPPLFAVDPALHWANPGQLECAEGGRHTDCKPLTPPAISYAGPVPIVTHVHGAHVQPDSDGFPTAWFLPDANDIPTGYATRGSLFSQISGVPLQSGAAVFQYPNDQAPATLWYHDHTLGMTHSNVYAGPVGFYLIREPNDATLRLPGPSPLPGMDPNGSAARALLREIPLVIHDRSFNADGSLFYPETRDFFEGVPTGTLESLGVRFTPDGGSDMPRIWQPEFFGNTVVVNGQTWPSLRVRKQRYRFRLLNASSSRFLILRFENDMLPFVQIGGDQGYLPTPVERTRILLGPSERADVIVDFSGVRAGRRLVMENVGPDEPFGGGEPCVAPGSIPGSGCDFVPADPGTTGKVMAFDVQAGSLPDPSRVPRTLPTPSLTLTPTNVRRLSLNEGVSNTERVCVNGDDENLILVPGTANDEAACSAAGGALVPFGPRLALLGTLDASLQSVPQHWDAPVTENPALDSTETWEIYNFTEDAHPIHLHLVSFRVQDRQALVSDAEGMAMQPAELVPGTLRGPDVGESAFKDTVIAYPGEVTRVTAHFDRPGLYVWHCHIIEHEDNEMMRPYCVGSQATCPLPLSPSP